ncbi:unnamed protein product [Plutella xylostella]|uniref:ditrans,polycis-polyprenyl diphosphate synthase [(2E,6E)-farnesyldiphosphate specific] n=1 Tax=Plutella xylostella TaxID=51655 RepID=A0A8S4FZJ5_PLUXY|nr:unnamed protein product [Plutella xylostella]
MLARFFGNLLFNLVHLVLAILVAVNNVYRRFWRKPAISRDEVTKYDLQLVRENVPQLRKKLHHLVMLSDTDQHSLDDLAFIVIWSLLVGIPYVTFYDITGDLIENEQKFFLEVEKRKKGIPGFIKWSKMPDLNGFSNGTQPHTVNVNIFSYDDGQPKIAECIRKIALKELPCDSSSDEFTAQELDKSLSLMYTSIPEPDLALYTGSSCRTFGLLPWQIRLTEFIKLSEDSSINVSDFLGALCKYNKCDQRYGK